MNEITSQFADKVWPLQGISRLPAWIYSDPELFQREMDTFFFGPAWNYIGLECEVPNPGSFRRSWIATKQVLMTRDLDGEVHVLENRCAHRGTPVCWKASGEARSLTCPYHQWTYELNGKLQGLPFLRGAMGKGGMPRDFNRNDHKMRHLKTHVRGGVVWASFGDNPPDFESYVGKDLLELYDRQCNGRQLRLLGYSRQLLPNNWKLYIENLRDPYHATILHSFFVTFGLFRADVHLHNDSPEDGRHEMAKTVYSADTRKQVNEASAQMSNIKADYKLEDMSIVSPIDEYGDGALANFNLFPSVHVQQHANIFSMRHIVPKDVNSMELTWTQFGYADDDEAMQEARLKQANLIGPAGLVSVEDGEVLAVLQTGVRAYPEGIQVLEMGGRDVELPSDNMLHENLLRAFYRFYRREMGL